MAKVKPSRLMRFKARICPPGKRNHLRDPIRKKESVHPKDSISGQMLQDIPGLIFFVFAAGPPGITEDIKMPGLAWPTSSPSLMTKPVIQDGVFMTWQLGELGLFTWAPTASKQPGTVGIWTRVQHAGRRKGLSPSSLAAQAGPTAGRALELLWQITRDREEMVSNQEPCLRTLLFQGLKGLKIGSVTKDRSAVPPHHKESGKGCGPYWGDLFYSA